MRPANGNSFYLGIGSAMVKIIRDQSGARMFPIKATFLIKLAPVG